MFTINQRGIAPILIIFTLLVGLIGGLILIKNPVIFQPKAGGGLPQPAGPETSFTLVQDISDAKSICNDILCRLGLSEPRLSSQQIRVNLLVRSDVAAANLFSAKLQFPADLIEVESIQTGDNEEGRICAQVITQACSSTDPQICKDFPTPCDVPEGWIRVQGGRSEQVTDPNVKDSEGINRSNSALDTGSFIKNWVEKYFDNKTGEISLIGGVPNPGVQTEISQPSLVMATIVFRLKKEGNVKISFDENSTIYSNLDNLNILTVKRDLDVKYKPLSSLPPVDDGFVVGLEAGAQFDTSKVQLVKESGASWVRLNFIVRDDQEWSGVNDQRFIDTYNQIIDAYQKEGIQIIGLIGAESAKGSPGGYDRNKPQDFTQKYVEIADAIISRFGDRVKVYELFNEPNDWAGGNNAQVPARYFAEYLEKIYQKIKIEKGRSDILLISGPLFSFDLTTAADYLTETYNIGINQLNWQTIKDQTGSYPLDGIGYHIYVSQGMGDQSQVESKLKENINSIKSIIDQKDPGKKIWITEFGWGTGEGRVSEEVQAANLEKAYQVLKDSSVVKLAMWFTLFDFDTVEWGLIRGNGVKKKAWFSFQKVSGETTTTAGLPPSTLSSPGPRAEGKGDGNNDGKIDLQDMSVLLSKFNTKIKGGVDLNGDEVINSFDFSLMINLLKEKKVIKG